MRSRFYNSALDGVAALIILKHMLNHSTRLDSVFAALADPTRRAIVERLSRAPASVSELAAPLDMSLPAVLQHLSVLEESGVVKSRKVGRVRTCRVEPAALRTAADWIAQRRAMWERQLDRLAEFLDEEDEADKGRRK
jgi:DNA-binding transcriptional ArsR family regulator